MALTGGTLVGEFRIESLLGTGGMGAVYRAHDTKLNRDVALKVLLPEVAHNPERLARFRREAQILASLNHPNIAHIHGLEEADGVVALVLELVEGKTLAHRISRGAMPLDEALPIAKQIAEALEAAHEQGIVHRDLKPANIKVREDGTVKVLDFGLAKAMEPASTSASSAALTNSPTITSPAMMTGVGVLLGTAAYMSPEQARGRPADKRTDIWAIGVILFEMLTARRPFDGPTVSDTVAAILTRDPNWAELPPETPVSIRRLLVRCLAKERKSRVPDAADARLAIDDVNNGSEGMEAPKVAGRVWRHAAWMILATAAVAAGITAAVMNGLGRGEGTGSAGRPSVHATLGLPSKVSLLGFAALSPDGTQVAARFARDGWTGVWLRALDEPRWTRIESTRNARSMFWSPDGRSIAFFADSQLKVVSVTGGPATTLCTDTGSGEGSWSPVGEILFNTEPGVMHRVDTAGGECRPVFPSTDRELSRFPAFLPDGRHFLYVRGSVADTRFTGGGQRLPGIYLSSLDGSTESPIGTRLLPDDSGAIYAEAASSDQIGHLLFMRGSRLMAQPFDARALELRGDPRAVADSVSLSADTQLSASVAGGRLLFLTGRARLNQLTAVDRRGANRSPAGLPTARRAVAVAPDGSRVIMSGGGEGVELYDLERHSQSHVSTDPGARAAIWSPDGSSVVFTATVKGVTGMFRQPVSGGEPALLLRADGQIRVPSSWSRDGRFLFYTEVSPGTGADIWYLTNPGAADSTPTRFLATPAAEGQAQISADGQWLAYAVTNEQGAGEVYLRRFPSGDITVKVSTGGDSREPRWSSAGTELYYLRGAAQFGWEVTSVPVRLTRSPAGANVGQPAALFSFRMVPSIIQANSWLYAPRPDTEGFLIASQVEEDEPAIDVITEWRDLLRR